MEFLSPEGGALNTLSLSDDCSRLSCWPSSAALVSPFFWVLQPPLDSGNACYPSSLYPFAKLAKVSSCGLWPKAPRHWQMEKRGLWIHSWIYWSGAGILEYTGSVRIPALPVYSPSSPQSRVWRNIQGATCPLHQGTSKIWCAGDQAQWDFVVSRTKHPVKYAYNKESQWSRAVYCWERNR